MADGSGMLHVTRFSGSQVSDGHCILWIHGGGGVVGDNQKHYEWITPDLPALGATVFSVPYPLAPGPSPIDQVTSCVAAYQTLHKHASELGIDSDNIIIGGASYGGNLAVSTASQVNPRAVFALYGVHNLADPYFSDPKSKFPAEDFGKLSGDNSEDSIRTEIQERQTAARTGKLTKAVTYAPSEPPKDLRSTLAALGATDEATVRRDATMQRDIFQYSLGGPDRAWMTLLVPKPEGMTDEEHKAELERQSSMSVLDEKYSVPTLFVHGKGDRLVPWEQSEAAYQKLTKTNVDTECLYDKSGDHLFDKYWPVSPRLHGDS
jgi:acetyl esterase/lipase